LRKGTELQQRCFEFACQIVRLHDLLSTRGASARDLGRQLLRSGTSIGANLEEADAAQSKADFISKCTIALKEARESHFWLRLLVTTGKIKPNDNGPYLLSECDQLVAILTTIVKKTRRGKSE
jgi:four helix bundle protein